MTPYGRRGGLAGARRRRSSSVCAPRSSRPARSAWSGALGGFAGLFALDDERLLAATTDGVGTKLILSRRAGRLFDAGRRPRRALRQRPAHDRRGAALLPRLRGRRLASTSSEVAELVAGAASVCRAGRLRHPRRRDRGAARHLPRGRARLRGDDGRPRAARRPGRRLALRARRRRARTPVGGPARERLHARAAASLGDGRLRRRPPAPADAALPRGRARPARRVRRPRARARDRRRHPRQPPARPARRARRARSTRSSWERPPVYAWLDERGVPEEEQRRVFNLGVGFCAVVPAADAERPASRHRPARGGARRRRWADAA